MPELDNMRQREVKRIARRDARRLARGITSPLQPLPPIYPSEIAAATFSAAQQVKVDEVTAKAVARARRPYLKPCMLMKRALEFGRLQLNAMHKLHAILTT